MPKNRPHIIIFNPDQWRWDVMGHMGNPAAMTPTLDQLVESDAVSFSQAFCQNTVCTPSRCSFMTGWYPHVRGHRTMYHMLHPEHDEPNLLKILKENGYNVWWGGKNDLVPGQDGYADHCDVKFKPTQADLARWGISGMREGSHGQSTPWRGDPGGDNFFSFFKGKADLNGEPFYCDGDWAMVKGAIDAIRDYKGDKPLCIYLPISYPHPPYFAEEPYYSMIDRSALPARIPAPKDWSGKPSIQKGIWEAQNLQEWTEERWTELRATYYAMCTRVDEQVRQLLEAMQEAGIYDDSAFFLFSDHGDFTGDYGLVEKTQNTFEDVLSRVPLIVKPPKGYPVKARVTPAIAELVDFCATVYELTGIEPGYDHFGKSLLPVLAGSDTHRDAAFCEGGRRYGEEHCMELQSSSSGNTTGLYYPRLSFQERDDGPYHTKATMCRTAEFKYTRRHYESDELYDLVNDPKETRNLIADPAYAEVLAKLKERMLTWYMETCDVVPHASDNRT